MFSFSVCQAIINEGSKVSESTFATTHSQKRKEVEEAQMVVIPHHSFIGFQKACQSHCPLLLPPASIPIGFSSRFWQLFMSSAVTLFHWGKIDGTHQSQPQWPLNMTRFLVRPAKWKAGVWSTASGVKLLENLLSPNALCTASHHQTPWQPSEQEEIH